MTRLALIGPVRLDAPMLLALAALPAAWVGVWLVRAYALRAGVLDRPNERSSHRVPTPRGGGLGVVVSMLLAGGAAAAAAGIDVRVIAAAAVAVGAVAAVGWLDDRGSLGVRPRLATHLGAGVVVAAIAHVVLRDAGWPPPALWAWWALWTVSAVNVVNFMDGIDGLIGGQMLVFGAYVAAVAPSSAGALGLALAAASLGFLRWNWSPAAIFLGDVGSGPYGVLAVLVGLAAMRTADVTLVRAFLPLFPLFLDAAVTLARRARAGERVTAAHRSHLYQRLANGPWSHARTSLVYGALAALGAGAGLAPSGARVPAMAAYVAVVLWVGARLDARVPWRPARAPT